MWICVLLRPNMPMSTPAVRDGTAGPPPAPPPSNRPVHASPQFRRQQMTSFATLFPLIRPLPAIMVLSLQDSRLELTLCGPAQVCCMKPIRVSTRTNTRHGRKNRSCRRPHKHFADSDGCRIASDPANTNVPDTIAIRSRRRVAAGALAAPARHATRSSLQGPCPLVTLVRASTRFTPLKKTSTGEQMPTTFQRLVCVHKCCTHLHPHSFHHLLVTEVSSCGLQGPKRGEPATPSCARRLPVNNSHESRMGRSLAFPHCNLVTHATHRLKLCFILLGTDISAT